MRFFKKILLFLPLLAFVVLFLYGRKQDVSSSLEKEPLEKMPKEQQMVSEKNENSSSDDFQMQTLGYNDDRVNDCCKSIGKIDLCNSKNTFITASFIYWEPLSDQIDLGIVDFSRTLPRDYKIVKFSTHYAPGFKVGVGYNFKCDWDMYAKYTRLHSNQSTTFNPSPLISTNYFHTPWLPTETSAVGGLAYRFPYLSPVKANWNMHLDKIDLEFGNTLYNKKLVARASFGPSFNVVNERYKMHFVYDNTPRETNIKNDSWALGPRLGIDLEWNFYKNFKMFTNADLNLLFASNEVSGKGIINAFAVDTQYKFNKYKKYILRDIEELSLGFKWGSYFASDRWHIDFSAAYEVQRYANVNYMSKYAQMRTIDNINNVSVNQIKPGDTYLHGLTLSTKIDF